MSLIVIMSEPRPIRGCCAMKKRNCGAYTAIAILSVRTVLAYRHRFGAVIAMTRSELSA